MIIIIILVCHLYTIWLSYIFLVYHNHCHDHVHYEIIILINSIIRELLK